MRRTIGSGYAWRLRIAALMLVSGIPLAVLACFAAPTQAKRLDASEWHTCAVTDGGRVQCWGWGASFLPDGMATAKAEPADIPGFDEAVRDVAAGNSFSCALTVSGKLLCWGLNNAGQLGIGSDANVVAVPARVTGLGGATKAVAAGKWHACALSQAGGVACWGSNDYGALGAQGIMASSVPVAVEGLAAGVVAIDVGDRYSCAVLATGSVKCWGAIPQRYPRTAHPVPEEVQGFGHAVVSVAVGQQHACVLDVAGVVSCWGDGVSDLLGVPWFRFTETPLPLASLPQPAIAVGASMRSGCVITQGGAAWCWGSTGEQLGNGGIYGSPIPVPVYGLDAGVTEIAAGTRHACARVGSVLRCWGSSEYGQLGNGIPEYRSVPVRVNGLDGAFGKLSTYAGDTCALLPDGGAACWGWNAGGIHADGTYLPHSTPVAMSVLPASLRVLVPGYAHACASTTSGQAWCWGSNAFGALGNGSDDNYSFVPVPVQGLHDVVEFALGLSHTCARTTGGGVWCWGDDARGQLGDDGWGHSRVPRQVVGLASGVRQIAAGWKHACAIGDSGGLSCWGGNEDGELGDGSLENRFVPTPVPGFAAGTAMVSANRSRTCALKASGEVWCWGLYFEPTTPTRVQGLSADVVAISVGAGHACALTARGSIECWGDNEYGQLGRGSRTDVRLPPGEALAASSSYTSVTVGYNHVCATTAAGDALCWGQISTGVLGNGESRWSAVPVAVAEIPESLIFRSGFE